MATLFLGKWLYRASVVIWFFALLCAAQRPAYAYVDPGSGIFLLQVISSVFVGFTFLIRKRIREFFNRFAFSKKEAAGNDAKR